MGIGNDQLNYGIRSKDVPSYWLILPITVDDALVQDFVQGMEEASSQFKHAKLANSFRWSLLFSPIFPGTFSVGSRNGITPYVDLLVHHVVSNIGIHFWKHFEHKEITIPLAGE